MMQLDLTVCHVPPGSVVVRPGTSSRRPESIERGERGSSALACSASRHCVACPCVAFGQEGNGDSLGDRADCPRSPLLYFLSFSVEVAFKPDEKQSRMKQEF